MKYYLIICVIIILTILVCAGFIIPKVFGEYEDAGQFGDMFGVVNALFSGLAFVGVVCAILLQKEQLKSQQEELALTRKEIKAQTKIFSKQEKLLSLDNETQAFLHFSSKSEIELNKLAIRIFDCSKEDDIKGGGSFFDSMIYRVKMIDQLIQYSPQDAKKRNFNCLKSVEDGVVEMYHIDNFISIYENLVSSAEKLDKTLKIERYGVFYENNEYSRTYDAIKKYKEYLEKNLCA